MGVSQVNLNIKSSALSHALKGQEEEKSSSRLHPNGMEDDGDAASAPKRRSRDHVSLDLTGQFNCHVTAPYISSSSSDEDDMAPLFRVGRSSGKSWVPPSLFVSANYDFSSVWYGATRLLSTLRWDLSKRRDRLTSSDLEEDAHAAFHMPGFFPKFPRLLPNMIDLRTEKGLHSLEDYAAQLGIKWRQTNELQPPPSLTARVDTEGGATLSISVPIHQRITIKSSLQLPGQSFARDYFASRIPSWSPEQDSWIPDLSIGATGRLVSKSELGLSPRWARGGRAGVRLAVSRRALDWNALGFSQEDEDTLIRVEWSGVDETGGYYSALRLETVLEHIPETARLILCRDQLLPGASRQN